jgi:Protein kinase domain
MPDVLKRVGRYDLLEVVGRGGAAVVYLAHQRDLRRHVALKELAPYHAADTSFAERFVEESRLAGSMNHANVVTVHEFFEDGGVPYIAMEYLPYGSLRQYVGKLSTAQIAGVLEGVLAGLSHGEAHAIVHRDLKPENLLVATDGRVKIADFGVARAFNNAVTRAVVTVAGTTIGTPAYMSPEQALGSDLTPATDLYSLGIVAWELLTGQVPFEETDTPVAVLYRHVHEPIPSVRTVAPQVDEGIAVWLGRMLAKAPEERFQSADEAWEELEDVILDLLGPRWRREARLATQGGGAQAEHTLTPAAFDAADLAAPEVAADEPEPVRAPVAQTVGAREVEGPGTTIAPRRSSRRSNTTMLRIARRHRLTDDDGEGGRSDIVRRRLIAAAIVLAMCVAAAAGVIVAQSGGTSKPSGPTSAQRAAAEHAAAERAAAQRAAAAEVAASNKKLTNVVSRLGVSRTQRLTKLLNESTPKGQAADAAAIEKDYVNAAGRVQPLIGKSPLAQRLESSLTSTAAGYGRLAAAARAGNAKAWNRAWAAVRADENRLRRQVGQL